MAIGVRLKKSLNSKPRVSSGRNKETGNGLKSVNRMKSASRENLKEWRSKYVSDDNDTYSKPYNVRAKKFRSDRGQSRREVDMRGNLDLEHSERKMRRSDFTRDVGRQRSPLSMGERFGRKDRACDVGLSGRKPINRKRRDFDGDGSEEDTRSNVAVRALRSHRGKKMDDSRGKKVSYRSEERDVSVEASSDKLRLKWKKMDKKQKDFDGGDSEEERRGHGATHELRGHRGKKDDGRGRKISCRSEERGISVEASADKLRSKGNKMDGVLSKNRHKGDAEDELLEKNVKSEEKSNQIAEQKPIRRQARVLDKSGKKIRILQKPSDNGSAETDAPPKKKKRVIRIDPFDTSNKRLDDSAPTSGNGIEKDTEISKNAQFRAIQPSPSILSFVEDNLLGRRRLFELKNAGYNIKLSAPLDNIPFSTGTERERIEENVFRNKLEFFAAAKISSSFPPPMIPEIAFAGRSNVGKSSLLNALTRQWGVVRTSDKPGLTQTINFFRLASKLCLVDLPGYGFAYAKEEVKDAWEELVKEYVSTRVGLQRVCLLIDTKWGMKPRDHELIDLMERSQTPYQIVLTKTDVVFPIDVARRAMQIQENLKTNKSIVNPVMMLSSKSGAGVRNLRTVLAKIARFVKL